MQTTAQSRPVDLSESVRSLLAQKDHALWSISPEATVYEAVERLPGGPERRAFCRDY
jgi:hypothetical protein